MVAGLWSQLLGTMRQEDYRSKACLGIVSSREICTPIRSSLVDGHSASLCEALDFSLIQPEPEIFALLSFTVRFQCLLLPLMPPSYPASKQVSYKAALAVLRRASAPPSDTGILSSITNLYPHFCGILSAWDTACFFEEDLQVLLASSRAWQDSAVPGGPSQDQSKPSLWGTFSPLLWGRWSTDNAVGF